MLGEELGGALRMLEVAGADVVGVRSPADPLDARDPEYIERTLPLVRRVCETYFRGEVHGLEQIPSRGPVLMVGNHSGGTLIADTFVFAQAFYTRFGPRRGFHQLAHDLVFKVPGLRALLTRWGTIPASPDCLRRALERRAALLVYPGGEHETYRPSWQSSRVDFAGRTGFAELALELGVRIVPVVAIGGQETALFLGRGRRLARALALDRIARLKVLPPQLGPPLGLTILDLPARIPLPAKITIRVLPEIDLRARLGANASPEEAYDLVTGEMQTALSELADARRLPVIG